MADQGTRVALLAREGQARACLEKALCEAGAQLVAIADPVAGAASEVVAAGPHAVLVALEPAIEDALDRWAPLLSDPAIVVIYDEAELAAARSGWDAARWIRHLRAKLNRHEDVLPPGAEPEQEWQQLEPGPLEPQRREVSAEDFRPADEAGENAGEVQADAGLEAWLARMAGRGGEAPGPGAPGTAASGVEGDEAAGAPDDAHAALLAAAELVPAPAGAPAARLEDLETRISGLSLVDIDSYGHGPERGAVVVEAGLGGPDAVRQLLAELAAGFPKPLLVRLRLDGGRYDRLVRQMGRATSLTVALAEEGMVIEPGNVYFLPPGLGVDREKGLLRFIADDTAMQRLPDALPDADSAILFLSGASPTLADEAMTRAGAGALVLGQSPEDNFDPTATTRLLELAGRASTPAGIAAELLERWPPQDRPAGADLEDPEP